MRTKNLKFKTKPISDKRLSVINERFKKNQCKAQFIIWAEHTSLDTSGIWDGEPVFRPAICAWEAWKAAWEMWEMWEMKKR